MNLFGKDDILLKISGFVNSGRLPHALMFCGEQGAGRKTLADYIARLSVCTEKTGQPCGICNACYKAENRLHPDIIYVKGTSPDGKYKIDFLRNEIKRAYLLPNDGKVRILIFEDVDTMSPACQNTLLKFIEEPQSHNRFVFTAISDRNVLPTIRSRVTAIEVTLPTPQECLCALIDHGIDPQKAQALIEACGTNIGRCLQNADESENLALRAASGTAEALIKKDEYLLASAFAELKNRGQLVQTLRFLQEIIRDSIFIKTHNKNSQAVPDRINLAGTNKKASETLAGLYGGKSLLQSLKMIDRYISQTDFNPNINLAGAVYSSQIFSLLVNKNFKESE